MSVDQSSPFTVDFDKDAGSVNRPFNPAVIPDLAVNASRNHPLTPVAQAFLKQLRNRLSAIATDVGNRIA